MSHVTEATTQQASAAAPAADKTSHNATQAAAFDGSAATDFLQPLDDNIATVHLKLP